jgi:hypothetical protein
MALRTLPSAALRALRELSDTPGHRHLEAALRVTALSAEELEALAWRAAFAVAAHRWDSTMERVAAQGFCHALRAGDMDRAAQCARWIYAPDEAFRAAVAEVNAQHAATA